MSTPLVSIIMGSKSDLPVMKGAPEVLEELGIGYELTTLSAHRTPHRVMKLAEKFSLPIIAFVDTPGAYPGVGAEERGQAEAIAHL